MYARANSYQQNQHDFGENSGYISSCGRGSGGRRRFRLSQFGGSGFTVPIMGFGSSLAKGALKGAKESGVLGAVGGGMEAVSVGLSAAIFFGFLFSLIFKSKTKKG